MGKWPTHLKFTSWRFHEFDSRRKWPNYKKFRRDALKSGAVLYRLHHSGRYVPYAYIRPKGVNREYRSPR